MLVTDLDGTLLRDDKTISEKSIAALRRCREAGIRIVYATGRGDTMRGALKLPEDLFDGRVINNGAVAESFDDASAAVVYNSLIPYMTVRPFLAECSRRGLEAATQLKQMHYTNFNLPDEWMLSESFKIVDFSKHDQDTEKIYVVDCDAEIAKSLGQYLTDEVYLYLSRDGFAMVMHREATKSKAVVALAEYWGIEQSEIVAFGDDMNDIDLLEYAGIGVAMGNALDEVKAAADCVCLSNEEDGIAKWIEAKLISA